MSDQGRRLRVYEVSDRVLEERLRTGVRFASGKILDVWYDPWMRVTRYLVDGDEFDLIFLGEEIPVFDSDGEPIVLARGPS